MHAGWASKLPAASQTRLASDIDGSRPLMGKPARARLAYRIHIRTRHKRKGQGFIRFIPSRHPVMVVVAQGRGRRAVRGLAARVV